MNQEEADQDVADVCYAVADYFGGRTMANPTSALRKAGASLVQNFTKLSAAVHEFSR